MRAFTRSVLATLVASSLSSLVLRAQAPPSPSEVPDIVLHASDLTTIQGNWTVVPSAASPGGLAVANADHGWSTTELPQPSPADYIEATFQAQAGVSYHLWLRLRATGDSKWNDSVWVQFDDARDVAGRSVYAIGTDEGLLVNLERCFACGMSGWGWQDHAWWRGQSPIVTFEDAGTHTIRVQTREDGVAVDQIVLSPARFLATSPGSPVDDDTQVSAATVASAASVGPGASPNAAAPQATTEASAAAADPGTATDSVQAQAAPAASLQAPGTSPGVPVLTWNINTAVQQDGTARQQMDAIAALDPMPEILVLEEASAHLAPVYAGELRARTGRAWTVAFQGHCAPGAWNAEAGACESVQDEGVAILTVHPVVAQEGKMWPSPDCWHSARAAVHAAIAVNDALVQVFGTHLQTGSCGDAAAARLSAVAAVKTWVSAFPGPAIVAGDFNQVPGGTEIADARVGMAAMFDDTWNTAGAGAGSTYPVPSPSMKIDFWFQDRSGKVTALSSRVVTSLAESDHYPLAAVFVFK